MPEVITSTPQLEELVADLARDAEAGGGVLGVGDDEIDRVVVDEGRQALPDELAPGPADDVADEEDAHAEEIAPAGGRRPPMMAGFRAIA